MSILDSFRKFAQPYSDDEYDDYEDDEYIDDYAEEPRRASRRSAPVNNPPVEDDMEDEDFDFSAAAAAPASSASSAAAATGSFNGRVVNMNTGAKQQVVMFRPTNFNNTSKAADELRANKAIMMNLENVDPAMSRRVVDFLTGCIYSIDGSVRKVAQNAYLFCPRNMEIVGDLETLQAEVESYI